MDILAVNGSIGIGTQTPNESTILELNSNSKGFLPPRMNTNQRNSIPNPAEGLQIFNTDTKCLNFFTGTDWEEIWRVGLHSSTFNILCRPGSNYIR